MKEFVYKTDPGTYLNINEDDVLIDLPKNIFGILDGFGGSNIGDLITTEIKEFINNHYGKFTDDPDSTLPFYFNPKFSLEVNALANALVGVNKKIYSDNITKQLFFRGGAAFLFWVVKD